MQARINSDRQSLTPRAAETCFPESTSETFPLPDALGRSLAQTAAAMSPEIYPSPDSAAAASETPARRRHQLPTARAIPAPHRYQQGVDPYPEQQYGISGSPAVSLQLQQHALGHAPESSSDPFSLSQHQMLSLGATGQPAATVRTLEQALEQESCTSFEAPAQMALAKHSWGEDLTSPATNHPYGSSSWNEGQSAAADHGSDWKPHSAARMPVANSAGMSDVHIADERTEGELGAPSWHPASPGHDSSVTDAGWELQAQAGYTASSVHDPSVTDGEEEAGWELEAPSEHPASPGHEPWAAEVEEKQALPQLLTSQQLTSQLSSSSPKSSIIQQVKQQHVHSETDHYTDDFETGSEDSIFET